MSGSIAPKGAGGARRLYGSLTRAADLPGMHHHLVSYLRLLGFSVCALAVAVCTRFGAAHAATPAPEPRIANPPSQAEMAAAAVVMTDEERIIELEARLTALSAEIANLSKALEVLGPLPDHADLFIPVDMSDLDAPAARPGNPVSDIHNASLGALARLRPAMANIRIAAAGYDVTTHNIRLEKDLGEDETMTALCVELSALTGPARVVAPIRAW
jgi:hypothetical protein